MADAAQFGPLNFTMMSGAWWAAHALEVAGIGMVALLDDETGRAFDPECVAALRSIVASERPAPSPAPAQRELDPALVRGRPSPVFGEAAA